MFSDYATGGDHRTSATLAAAQEIVAPVAGAAADDDSGVLPASSAGALFATLTGPDAGAAAGPLLGGGAIGRAVTASVRAKLLRHQVARLGGAAASTALR